MAEREKIAAVEGRPWAGGYMTGIGLQQRRKEQTIPVVSNMTLMPLGVLHSTDHVIFGLFSFFVAFEICAQLLCIEGLSPVITVGLVWGFIL